MNTMYVVKGICTLKIEGTAKILDENGKTVRSENLGDVPEFQVPLESILPMPEDGQCGVHFTLEDIFRPFNS